MSEPKKLAQKELSEMYGSCPSIPIPVRRHISAQEQEIAALKAERAALRAKLAGLVDILKIWDEWYRYQYCGGSTDTVHPPIEKTRIALTTAEASAITRDTLAAKLAGLVEAAKGVIAYEDCNYGGGNDNEIARLRVALTTAEASGDAPADRADMERVPA